MSGPIEIIEQAAIKVDDTTYSVPRPGRHIDVYGYMRSRGVNDLGEQQGFKTNLRHFVDRKEAREIAERAGQIRAGAIASSDLFSEDLW